MAAAVLVGRLVRERRLALGLRQAAVARTAGISAAYLNLIEHDRRRVGPALLERLAGALGLAAEVLAGGGDAGLLQDLRSAAAAAPSGAETDRAEEFLSRFPGWAGLVAVQARRLGEMERAVAALNDRIGHDPHLQAALHELLSAASSVRSTAAILAETTDLAPDWRVRFHANLHQDSERLAAGAGALVAWLDAAEGAAPAAATPLDEVEAWLSRRGWHLPEVEPGRPGPDALADELAALPSEAARQVAADWVAVAKRDAAAMPLAAFEAAMRDHDGDPARLAAVFGVGVLAAMRRLALRPGAVEGLVICDAAGAFLLRKPAPGFPVPRAGAACALWPLFTALARPGVPVADIAEVPGLVPARFVLRAFCETRHPGGFGGPELRRAAMLVAPVAGTSGAAVLRVGGTCRICPRGDCAARREPSILADAGLGSVPAQGRDPRGAVPIF